MSDPEIPPQVIEAQVAFTAATAAVKKASRPRPQVEGVKPEEWPELRGPVSEWPEDLRVALDQTRAAEIKAMHELNEARDKEGIVAWPQKQAVLEGAKLETARCRNSGLAT